jgi:hypothetical protein
MEILPRVPDLTRRIDPSADSKKTRNSSGTPIRSAGSGFFSTLWLLLLTSWQNPQASRIDPHLRIEARQLGNVNALQKSADQRALEGAEQARSRRHVGPDRDARLCRADRVDDEGRHSSLVEIRLDQHVPRLGLRHASPSVIRLSERDEIVADDRSLTVTALVDAKVPEIAGRDDPRMTDAIIGDHTIDVGCGPGDVRGRLGAECVATHPFKYHERSAAPPNAVVGLGTEEKSSLGWLGDSPRTR